MKRFYEAKDWSSVVKEILGSKDSPIGPVQTNYLHISAGVRPRLIVICESPSDAEVAAGFPTVCSTGKRIYSHLQDSGMITLGHKLPMKYCFHSHYKIFSENGIYITNLVRYQADFGTKDTTKKDTTKKNSNVRNIWKITYCDLLDELDKISKIYNINNIYNIPVLIACGTAFPAQVKEVVEKCKSLDMKWYVTYHPSRSPKWSYKHYNPKYWEDGTLKRPMMKSIKI